MNKDQYILQLEKLVSELLVYSKKYHELVNKAHPELDIPEHIKPKKPLAYLLRGDFDFTSNRPEPRNNENLKQA